MHQLIVHCSGKKVILILDNASIHVCRYIKEFVKNNPNIEIFTLPTYSPEYNPAEQVWRWLKPRVCGLPKAMNGVWRKLFPVSGKLRGHGSSTNCPRFLISASVYGRIYYSNIYDDMLNRKFFMKLCFDPLSHPEIGR